MLELTVVDQDQSVLEEARAFNVEWTLDEPAPSDIDRLRAEYWVTNHGTTGDGLAVDEEIAGVDCRVVRADDPRGVYLHLHGGGFCLGEPRLQDRQLEGIAGATGATVVSVDYRLAPEHPYPAGLDDCHAVARALVDRGHDRVVIGGESAGANLSVATLLRLRDDGLVERIAAANLLYGGYTMGSLPSRDAWNRYLVLSAPLVDAFHRWYGGAVDDPQASPLVADLADLPPALFTVGTQDPLLDDSMLLATKWAAAGNDAVLEVWPEAPHAFDGFPTQQGALVRLRLRDWLVDAFA